MNQSQIDLIVGEVLTEIALAPENVGGTIQAVLTKKLPALWDEAYEKGRDAAARDRTPTS